MYFMKSKLKTFYLLVALALVGVGGQAAAQIDSTNMRGEFRPSRPRVDLPTPAGSQCGWRMGSPGNQGNNSLVASCQGYDLQGTPAGWNTVLYYESTVFCWESSGDPQCQGEPAGYRPAFVPSGTYNPRDGYGNALVAGGAGWQAGTQPCPSGYNLTVIGASNNNETVTARVCIAN